MLKKCAEYNQPLFTAFIDYEKAFDSVEASAVMQALRTQGVDEPYLKIVEDICSGSKATIVLHKESKKIRLIEGVSNAIDCVFTGDIQSPGLGPIGDKSHWGIP